MNGTDLIGSIIAGLMIGASVKFRGLDRVGNLIVGVVGALLGGFLADPLGFSGHGFLVPFLLSMAGAATLLLVIGVINRK